MKAPLRLLPPWSGKKLARLREIERDFHVRAFGEELARVNLDLTIKQRLEYLAWMRRAPRQHKAPSIGPQGQSHLSSTKVHHPFPVPGLHPNSAQAQPGTSDRVLKGEWMNGCGPLLEDKWD